jgi:hypothetical protein
MVPRRAHLLPSRSAVRSRSPAIFAHRLRRVKVTSFAAFQIKKGKKKLCCFWAGGARVPSCSSGERDARARPTAFSCQSHGFFKKIAANHTVRGDFAASGVFSLFL